MYYMLWEIYNTTEELRNISVQVLVGYHRRQDIPLEGDSCQTTIQGKTILLLADHQGHTQSGQMEPGTNVIPSTTWDVREGLWSWDRPVPNLKPRWEAGFISLGTVPCYHSTIWVSKD